MACREGEGKWLTLNLARPGGICISADVYRHVAGKINANFVSGGRQRLKNIADPVEVYHVSIDEASPTLLADISAVRTRWSSGLRLPAAWNRARTT